MSASRPRPARTARFFGSGWENWGAASEPKTERSSIIVSSTIDVSTIQVGDGRDFQGSTNGFYYSGCTFE